MYGGQSSCCGEPSSNRNGFLVCIVRLCHYDYTQPLYGNIFLPWPDYEYFGESCLVDSAEFQDSAG